MGPWHGRGLGMHLAHTRPQVSWHAAPHTLGYPEPGLRRVQEQLSVATVAQLDAHGDAASSSLCDGPAAVHIIVARHHKWKRSITFRVPLAC
jgi:hypothetical protein